jgi:hypothetical protein
MKQNNKTMENLSNKKQEKEQVLYNLLFTGKITLKEYLQKIKGNA